MYIVETKKALKANRDFERLHEFGKAVVTTRPAISLRDLRRIMTRYKEVMELVKLKILPDENRLVIIFNSGKNPELIFKHVEGKA